MRKGTIKAAVLAAVFIGAVLIFGRFMNDTNEDLTTEMKEATLPVITMYQGDQELNELHGYVTEMDAAYMRDTITPVGEDRKLPIVIQTNQTAVDTISYEIRSLDATRLIANADVTSYEEHSGKLTADDYPPWERRTFDLLLYQDRGAGRLLCERVRRICQGF